MNNTDTDNNAKPAAVEAPDEIRNQIANLRAFAKIATAPAVLAVLDRFNGKTINRRLWDALTEAAKTVEGRAAIYGPNDRARYGLILEISHWYGGKFEEMKIYETPNTDRDKTATGKRLDAAGVRADIERAAGEWNEIADRIEEQSAHFCELLAELRALGAAARAFCKKWRPEFRNALAYDYGAEIQSVAQLESATRDYFRSIR